MPYMRNVGDLKKNREYYLRTRFPNLTYLFKKRFEWMHEYIIDSDEVLEVGCGIGITKLFVKRGHITLSDIVHNPWVDRREDALDISYEDESLDVIIANNVIHHLAKPLKFFQESARVLKVGGRMLIQDVECSFFMQKLLRLMHIEDFNFQIDIFDINNSCSNPLKPWESNVAVPNLLFRDVFKFEKHVPYFRVLEKKHSEFFIYICSGGINGKTFAVPLPYIALKMLDAIDHWLVSILPMVFALQMNVVLEKKDMKRKAKL